MIKYNIDNQLRQATIDILLAEQIEFKDVNDLTRAPGVYTLQHHGVVVYAGKAQELRKRLTQHDRKLRWAGGIAIEDMKLSVLSCDEFFVQGLELYIIKTLKPAWNGLGFGSNAPGNGRDNQKTSKWCRLYQDGPHSEACRAAVSA
jgi:hypothetical protein